MARRTCHPLSRLASSLEGMAETSTMRSRARARHAPARRYPFPGESKCLAWCQFGLAAVGRAARVELWAVARGCEPLEVSLRIETTGEWAQIHLSKKYFGNGTIPELSYDVPQFTTRLPIPVARARADAASPSLSKIERLGSTEGDAMSEGGPGSGGWRELC